MGPASLPRKSSAGKSAAQASLVRSFRSSPQPACKGQAANRQGQTGRGGGEVLDPIPAQRFSVTNSRVHLSDDRDFHVWGNGFRRGCHEHTRFGLRTESRKRKGSHAGRLPRGKCDNLGRGCRGQAVPRVRPFLRRLNRHLQALTRRARLARHCGRAGTPVIRPGPFAGRDWGLSRHKCAPTTRRRGEGEEGRGDRKEAFWRFEAKAMN